MSGNGPTSLDSIRDVEALDERLSEPPQSVIETFSRLAGDLLVLGVAGKMGPTLAWMARRAMDAAGGRDRRVYGVARFSEPGREAWLRDRGIATIRCDLLEDEALERIPDVPNIVSMFTMKFGATGQEARTWALNAFVPGLVAQRFRRSRIVAFSTGNVYGHSSVVSGGSRETDRPEPVGEYGMSCLGRERILEHLGKLHGISLALIRLNYAVEMRYGVLVDLARRVQARQPIDVTMGYFNVIWQADANAIALRALEHAAVPPLVLNVTGPEILSVRSVAERFAERFDVPVSFRGTEAPDALLNNAEVSRRRFGPPGVDASRLIDLTADWILSNGPTFDKPTRFEARDGRF